MTADPDRDDHHHSPTENGARSIAALLAAGYLRLLAQRAAALATIQPAENLENPVDSRRPKSVNWVEHEGGRDA
jgi:hypothetical protein